MTAKIIDGKEIAKKIREEIKKEVDKLGKTPGLAVVLVGENPASQVYVNMKEKDSKEVGFYSEKHVLKSDTEFGELIALVNQLNNDPKIHGMLVQLPLPDSLEDQLVIDAIRPEKDSDGFHPINMGNLMIGLPGSVPCTPKGIITLIESTGESIEGKHAVVVGRSNIVGKPIAMLLLQKNATVTICHSRTKDLAKITKDADILVAAVGRPNFITADMIKKDSIVIDVGINRVDGKLVGDVEFESAKKVAGHITPVPGGVGPMTRACLLQNTLEQMKKIQKL